MKEQQTPAKRNETVDDPSNDSPASTRVISNATLGVLLAAEFVGAVLMALAIHLQCGRIAPVHGFAIALALTTGTATLLIVRRVLNH